MAIYSLPGSVSRNRGSEGGSTFQKTANGYVIRRRAVPTNKNTASQTVTKNRFASIAQRWRTLSAGDQLTWDNEAPNYPRTDSLGNVYDLTDQQLQQSSNLNLLAAGLAPIDSIPAASSFPSLIDFDVLISYGTSQAFFVTNPDIIPAAVNLDVYVTMPMAFGQSNPDIRKMLLLSSFASGSDMTDNNFALYASLFPSFPVSSPVTMFAACRYSQQSTGQKGATLFARGVFV